MGGWREGGVRAEGETMAVGIPRAEAEPAEVWWPGSEIDRLKGSLRDSRLLTSDSLSILASEWKRRLGRRIGAED